MKTSMKNKEWLIENIDGFKENTAQYFIDQFSEDYITKDIHCNAFWYLGSTEKLQSFGYQ